MFNREGSNISSKDLDQETTEKLKGDVIGDTLYSQSFVLRTLLQFSDLKWGQEVENDLCFLWDMTVEPEVCKYLFEISFPSIACSAVAKYEEKRFIEIVVGILANILCADCDKNITEDEVKVILNELDTDDSLILIQVVRFISAIAFIHDQLPFITETVSQRLSFILSSSINTELLLKTLEALSKITQDLKLESELVDRSLYDGTISAFCTVFNDENDSFEIDTQEKRDVTKFMLEVVTNICAYVNEYDHSELLLEMRRCNKFPAIVNNVVTYYTLEENLFPISEEVSFYLSALTYIFPIIDVKFCNDLFFSLYRILDLIISCDNKDELKDVRKSVLELLGYQIYRADKKVVCKSFLSLSKKSNLIAVLNLLKKSEGDFDFKFCEKLESLTDKL